MAQKFVHCLEELSIHKGELKELEELIKRCNINISYLQKQAARVYNNHVESLRGAGDCKKSLQGKLGNITAERDSFQKKVQR